MKKESRKKTGHIFENSRKEEDVFRSNMTMERDSVYWRKEGISDAFFYKNKLALTSWLVWGGFVLWCQSP